jgi:hypothetical protein
MRCRHGVRTLKKMTRRSRRWLAAVALVAAVATGAILANFALLDAAAGDEPAGKLSPLIIFTGPEASVTGEAPSPSTPTRTAPAETAQPPSQTPVSTMPDVDLGDDSHGDHVDSDSGVSGDDRDD